MGRAGWQLRYTLKYPASHAFMEEGSAWPHYQWATSRPRRNYGVTRPRFRLLGESGETAEIRYFAKMEKFENSAIFDGNGRFDQVRQKQVVGAVKTRKQ